jgi:hypothetical protein
MLRHIVLSAAVLAIAPLAQAADNGIYLGAGYVQSDYGLEDPDIGDFDDEDGGFKLIAGWRVIDNFGVEVNYIDHGDATIGDGRLGAETISGFAVGYIDFPAGRRALERRQRGRGRPGFRLGRRHPGADLEPRRAARVRAVPDRRRREARHDLAVVYLHVPLGAQLRTTR